MSYNKYISMRILSTSIILLIISSIALGASETDSLIDSQPKPFQSYMFAPNDEVEEPAKLTIPNQVFVPAHVEGCSCQLVKYLCGMFIGVAIIVTIGGASAYFANRY